jgi:hypothetical protein
MGERNIAACLAERLDTVRELLACADLTPSAFYEWPDFDVIGDKLDVDQRESLANAWGYLTGAADMVDLTVMELLGEHGLSLDEDKVYRCACSWVGGDPDERPGKPPTCPACWHHDRKRVVVKAHPHSCVCGTAECAQCLDDTMRDLASRAPDEFHVQADGALVCPHRDLTCCGLCAEKYEQVVDVYGVHYWVPDPKERAALVEDRARDLDPVEDAHAAAMLGLVPFRRPLPKTIATTYRVVGYDKE